MGIKSSYIFLKDVRIHSYHGLIGQERLVGADFLLNLRVKFSVQKAIDTDDVNNTVNYANLYYIIKEEMSVYSNLIEFVAGRIINRIKTKYPEIEAIDLSIIKVNPPIGAECGGAGVEIHMSK